MRDLQSLLIEALGNAKQGAGLTINAVSLKYGVSIRILHEIKNNGYLPQQKRVKDAIEKIIKDWTND